jgi:quercetin dioxygenase-like cupin family protein
VLPPDGEKGGRAVFETKLDLSQIRDSWTSRGFSFDAWTDPPGQEWKDYVHATDELLIVLEGELELEMMGRVFRPRVGEEVFIPADMIHTVRNVGSSPARWLYGYRR